MRFSAGKASDFASLSLPHCCSFLVTQTKLFCFNAVSGRGGRRIPDLIKLAISLSNLLLAISISELFFFLYEVITRDTVILAIT